MKPRLKLLVLLTAVSVLGGSILILFPVAAPIHEGTSAGFLEVRL